MSPKPISRKENIVVQELENEVLIYDLNSNKAFCLNETSALVFQLCNGTRSVAEISDSMSIKMKTLVSEGIVWLAIEELRREKLISFEVKGVFAGMSRREMVRKVGLASMVTLPVVMSVIAPTAVTAASCLLLNDACTPGPGNGGCCPSSLCNFSNVCGCYCSSPGQCLTQTSCPSSVNCNIPLMVCSS